jgi:CRP-like cAMP-binding protein
MTDAQKATFVSSLQLRYFDAGDLILREGEQGDVFWIVEAGRVAFLSGVTETNSAARGATFGEQGIVWVLFWRGASDAGGDLEAIGRRFEEI